MDGSGLAMMLLAAYDISMDKRRSRLAALLQSVGDRIQKSVFVLHLSAEELAALRERAAAIIDPNEDSLIFFHQCSTCQEQTDTLGQAQLGQPVLCWITL